MYVVLGEINYNTQNIKTEIFFCVFSIYVLGMLQLPSSQYRDRTSESGFFLFARLFLIFFSLDIFFVR